MFMLDRLPEELIEYILSFNTYKCIDCKHSVYENVKQCSSCNLKACKYHSKHRFAFSPIVCNNCYFWENGLPACAKGSTEW